VELAVKLWELGGIAQVHQFQTIEKEAEMVRAIKARGAKSSALLAQPKITKSVLEHSSKPAERLVHRHAARSQHLWPLKQRRR